MSSRSAIDPSIFEGHTILLVEDNEDEVFMMRRAFRKAGVDNPLQTVSDGEKAIAYLEGTGAYSDRRQFTLPLIILLDLNMPKMGGLEVLQWLRRHPPFQRTTVHVLTASNRGEDVEQTFDAGANAYIVKPSKFEALVELVKAWHTLAQYAAFPSIDHGGGGGTGFPAVCRNVSMPVI